MTTREVAFLENEEIVAVHAVNGLRVILQLGTDPCPLVSADAGAWSYRDPDDREPPSLGNRVTSEILASWERALVGRRIVEADVRNGVLELRMVDGTVLRAHPDDHYEGWRAEGPGVLVISLPGGELTVFGGGEGKSLGSG